MVSDAAFVMGEATPLMVLRLYSWSSRVYPKWPGKLVPAAWANSSWRVRFGQGLFGVADTISSVVGFTSASRHTVGVGSPAWYRLFSESTLTVTPRTKRLMDGTPDKLQQEHALPRATSAAATAATRRLEATPRLMAGVMQE